MDEEKRPAVAVADEASPRSASSRRSLAGAGWRSCSGPGSWIGDVPPDVRPLSWLRPSTLWRSRNEVIARALHDPTDRAREAWVRLARERAGWLGTDPDFRFRVGGEDGGAFLVFGDPGEGDASQYSVVPGLLRHGSDVDFACIVSDVVYPSGDSADYREKFYWPYRALCAPIAGVPGNHDWYDGLHGFMYHLCRLDAAPPSPRGPGVRGLLAALLWRRPWRPSDAELAEMESLRGAPEQRFEVPPPAPYWALDLGPLRVVTIDTGISGALDAEQGDWLRRVATEDGRPKVLLTGRPIYVDGEHHPGRICDRAFRVDDVVCDPRANFVAAIGGDIHNYQRYPVRIGDGRTIQYIVSGGGGAYMHATHRIPKVALPGVTEEEFRCYPLRGDSLARFSEIFDRRLASGRGLLRLTPDEAASYLADLYGMRPTRPGPPPAISRRAHLAARLIQPLPAERGFHRFASEALDSNDPPLFRQFLRLDVTRSGLRIRCFGVTGCADTVGDPPIEDEVAITF